MTKMDSDKIVVGISACLLGHKVRYNGVSAHDKITIDKFTPHFEWIPVCPEVEIGLGTPREPIRLVQDGDGTKLIGTKSRIDLTERMQGYADEKAAELAKQPLAGYILKRNSPSCGMERVRVYNNTPIPIRNGTGLFTKSLEDRFPNLPIEEEGRLQDTQIRENFATRLFAYDRWLKFRASSPSLDQLMRFHAANKMLLLAHDNTQKQKLGNLIATAESCSDALLDEYETRFMNALKKPTTRGQHINVIQHLLSSLKARLSQRERTALEVAINEYRQGWVPLTTPLVLLQHYLSNYVSSWIEGQTYLDPYPRDLALRSHV
jgi:uncharacterized protein YbgA (DUF1722 family)/uncharacterized protein YbbK (DUF523 family)